jgi:hypothetical protein
MTAEPHRLAAAAAEAEDPPDARTLARQRTDAVMKRLDEWLASEEDRASLAAATMLLDRGWGKVEGRTDPTGAPVTVIRAPMVAEDTEAWREQYAPLTTR